MRVLFASTRGAGHFNPLVPFIEAARRRGHEVLVAGPPALADAVERAGYGFWEGAEPPADELGAVWSHVPTVSPDEANAMVVGDIFGRLNTRAMLPGLSAACEEWRPDLIVREVAEFASAIAAERHGVPHARVAVTFSRLEEEALELAGPTLEEHHAGVVERIRASPYLTHVPASLDDSETVRPGGTHRFRDPGRGDPDEPVTDWRAGDSRPLVYVSFGSEAGAMPIAGALYAAVFEAAKRLPARILVTLGQRDADVDALGPSPPNVRVEPWVSPAGVLAQAAAAVAHGGFGTTLGALAAGLPLVVVPLFGDQPENARRVEASGAGMVVWPDADGPAEAIRSSLDPGALAAAVQAVLGNSNHRDAARRVAAEMAALPPTDTAFDVLKPAE